MYMHTSSSDNISLDNKIYVLQNYWLEQKIRPDMCDQDLKEGRQVGHSELAQTFRLLDRSPVLEKKAGEEWSYSFWRLSPSGCLLQQRICFFGIGFDLDPIVVTNYHPVSNYS